MSKDTINVNHIMRLVELNKNNEINFELEFTAKSKNNEPFQLLVVDQQTLDDNDNLQYQNVNGIINGNIRSDKNIYKKYLLALKSQNPCEVEVSFMINRLPDNIPQPEDIKPLPQVQVEKNISWRMILIFIVIIIGVIILLYVYNSNSKDSSKMLWDSEGTNTEFNFSEFTNSINKPDIFSKFKELDL
jgi:hypothetical protein